MESSTMPVEYVHCTSNPELSVVVPSVPAHDASATAGRLIGQTVDCSYEVLLVNDATLDRSAARNAGLRTAAAPVVALTDDDCLPPPGWLANVWAAFEADPTLVCLEGPVYGGCRDFGPRHYVGCNLAVDRAEALGVGGFRSAFSEWREDTEFGWRMERDASGSCRYDGTVRMCHPSVPRTAFKREYERRLRREYPERYATVMNATLRRRLYREARAVGLTQPMQRARNVGRSVLRSIRGTIRSGNVTGD